MRRRSRSRSGASRADNENGAENATGSVSAGELALDVQVVNMAGDTLAQSRVDPRLCNGIMLQHLIADQAQYATGRVILVGPNGSRLGIEDSEPLITDRFGLLGNSRRRYQITSGIALR